MHIACAILRNALTCMYTNATSQNFAVDPSIFQDHFSWTFTPIHQHKPEIEMWPSQLLSHFKQLQILAENKISGALTGFRLEI